MKTIIILLIALLLSCGAQINVIALKYKATIKGPHSKDIIFECEEGIIVFDISVSQSDNIELFCNGTTIKTKLREIKSITIKPLKLYQDNNATK